KEALSRIGKGVLVLPSSPEVLRNGDTNYPFRQESSFYYLTGFTEPGSVCVLTGAHEKERFVLFVRPRDPEAEMWNGRRAGIEGARERFGADAAYPIEKLAEMLPEYLKGAQVVYYAFGQAHFDPKMLSALQGARRFIRDGINPPSTFTDPMTLLGEMRLRKGPAEIARMRKAAEITAAGHAAAVAVSSPGKHEYELEAALEHEFRRRGAQGPAYPSIVGSGDNATILHYTENHREMEAGDLVLIDAAAEYGYYACDVTRTFPVDGKMRPAQKALYDVVLKAQVECIRMTRPGVRFEEVHTRSVELLTEGMIGIGLLKGKRDEMIESKAFRRYFMHKTGHWLGLDVHDIGAYRVDGASRPLEPGMVFTIEPGLYVGASDETAPKEFRGLGIRIEDDILVTPDGCDVLTKAIPK
ncbi:MAG: aminopeptidase P N-terminal domain-containing protein, partial [Planctomycetes bacterium]|nr:aminopeptidase P N-terminal domain-containing protein [Planctomycetota bacterium]